MLNTENLNKVTKLLDGGDDFDTDLLIEALCELFSCDAFIKAVDKHLSSVQGVEIDFAELTNEAYWQVNNTKSQPNGYTNDEELSLSIAYAILLSGNVVLIDFIKSAYHVELDYHHDKFVPNWAERDDYAPFGFEFPE